MNLETLALIAFVLAAIPCGLFLLNLRVYRPLPRGSGHKGDHSESAECKARSAELKSEPANKRLHRRREGRARHSVRAVVVNRTAGTILPMTALLLGGQVLPFVLLACAPMLSSFGLTLAAFATALACVPRLIATHKFRQPLGAALLHPFGVLALLAIQWFALALHFAGKPSVWKGRAYLPASAVQPAKPA